MKYEQEFEKYLAKEKGASRSTASAYLGDLREFCRFMEGRGKTGETAGNADVAAFLRELKEAGRSGATVNRKLASVRSYYAYLRSAGLCSEDPTMGLKAPKQQRKDVEFLSVDEVNKLLETPGEDAKGIRDRARRSVIAGQASAPADWQSSDFADPQALVNAVMWERVIELTGEGHEWFDTHRRGAAWLRDNIAIPANAFYMGHLPDFTAYLNARYPGAIDKGAVFPEVISDLRKGLLCAYPESELRLNVAENRQNDFFWQ